MLLNELPINVDPFKEQQIAGKTTVSKLSGLKESGIEHEADIIVELNIGRDDEGFHYITGKLEADLTLTCQRCLQPMVYNVQSEFSLSPINDAGKHQNLPSRYEPVVMENNKIFVPGLLTEEILLKLPIIPKHESTDCNTLD